MQALAANQNQPSALVSRGRLLIVDGDELASRQLASEMQARGFSVRIASSIAASLETIAEGVPDYVLVEILLGKENGLEVVSTVHARHPEARIVLHSSHGTLPIVVAAIKAGAADCLVKPISVDAIEASLLSDQEPLPPPIGQPLAAAWVRWEHIRKVFSQTGSNVSETARRLRMHRRTLQRILAKGEPRD